jgi:hypothetical protein
VGTNGFHHEVSPETRTLLKLAGVAAVVAILAAIIGSFVKPVHPWMVCFFFGCGCVVMFLRRAHRQDKEDHEDR